MHIENRLQNLLSVLKTKIKSLRDFLMKRKEERRKRYFEEGFEKLNHPNSIPRKILNAHLRHN